MADVGSMEIEDEIQLVVAIEIACKDCCGLTCFYHAKLRKSLTSCSVLEPELVPCKGRITRLAVASAVGSEAVLMVPRQVKVEGCTGLDDYDSNQRNVDGTL